MRPNPARRLLSSKITCCVTGATADVVMQCTPCHGAESSCAQELCKPDGARCPRGTSCNSDVCVSDLPVTCPSPGSRHCKTGELCEWSPAKTSCVQEASSVEEPGEPRGVFRCTTPRDCGPGNQCCTRTAWHNTYCATNCDVSNSMLVCDSAADCKPKLRLLPPNYRRRAKLACKMEPDGPSWLKFCTLDLPE